jgi:asparagine synthase (glutamine-hydrolysing)
MCGIAGYFSGYKICHDPDAILRMAHSIAHRGPDDEGYMLAQTDDGRCFDFSGAASVARMRAVLPALGHKAPAHNLAFSHRRFAIVDTSSAGHQPKWDRDRQVCVAFNGEIYNYRELRAELETLGRHFEGNSDTEVLLAAYLEWGCDALAKCNGPLALALFDRRRGALLLARDRLGKAPLYYAHHAGRLLWASEIKAILTVCPDRAFPIRAQAVDDYVIHGWRDLDGSFWEGIHDFPPASFAWVSQELELVAETYWRMPEPAAALTLAPDEAASRLRELLSDAVRLRLRADVPVAFELSGGMDSSALVALAASTLTDRVAAYTVKFDDGAHDEEPYARLVAERYREHVDYQVLTPAQEDFWAAADAFVRAEEEPFHSPNLHTLQLQRRTIRADGIKVVISGSAGDEVLAGYAVEYLLPYLRQLIGRGEWRQFWHEARTNSELGLASLLRRALQDGLSRGLGQPVAGIQMRRVLAHAYRAPANIVRRGNKSQNFAGRVRDNLGPYMMNYWLRSGNKASFAVPIEPRAPFLDYRVVEFALSLPPQYLIHDGWHKWLLRKATEDLLPQEVVWRRRKMGFPFPHTAWLQFSKATVAALLADTQCPYVDAGALMKRYDALAVSQPLPLWRLVCLSLWWRRMVTNRSIGDSPVAAA